MAALVEAVPFRGSAGRSAPRSGRGSTAVSTVDGPDLLDIVEDANLGPEKVNDDITRIDQHPVAVRKAFDLHLAQAVVFQGAQEVIGKGSDVTVRTARCNDHRIRHWRLAAQVDQDEVLSLVVVELCKNGVLKVCLTGRQGLARAVKTGVSIPVLSVGCRQAVQFVRRVGDGFVVRVVRGRGGQRKAPIVFLKTEPITDRSEGHPLLTRPLAGSFCLRNRTPALCEMACGEGRASVRTVR